MFQRHVVVESLSSLMSNELNTSAQNKHKIIVANWKMNGSKTLLKEFSTLIPTNINDIIICPPFTLLGSAKTMLPDLIIMEHKTVVKKKTGPLQAKYRHQCYEKAVYHM